jgi:hypothetical protein
MTLRRFGFIPAIVATLLLMACAEYEGLYQPSCIAYEGETIELRNGHFEWRRFTDQRSVDADGNIIEPFPDYPKSGKYNRDAAKLSFLTNDGAQLDDRFLIDVDGQFYLLTKQQHSDYLAKNAVPRCALRRTDAAG